MSVVLILLPLASTISIYVQEFIQDVQVAIKLDLLTPLTLLLCQFYCEVIIIAYEFIRAESLESGVQHDKVRVDGLVWRLLTFSTGA